MIRGIREFFEERLAAHGNESDEDRICRIQLASAALLMELINTDRHVDEREEAEFARVLRETLSLDEETLAEITELAHQEARQATSLYEFTSLVNDGYAYADKVQLIENMWRIAWADGHLDKYEEQMIRKTAELIYVRHNDFIRAKLQVRDGLAKGH
ncbi:MAG: TerB family tellurite resistance protein [Pseudohongiellaceae bacterium]